MTAYRIETPRLVVRCYEPRDAAVLGEAIEASLEHLRPWMWWADREPLSLDRRVALLRNFRARFDLDEDYTYAIWDRAETTLLGGTGLHARLGVGAREIGYWIRPTHAGRGLVSEAVSALVCVAFDHHRFERIEIHCDVRNAKSAAVPRRVGFVHESIQRGYVLPERPEWRRDMMIWTLPREGWVRPPLEVDAFDAVGRKLPLDG